MNLLESIIRSITPQDYAARIAAEKRLGQLTMPHWALGRLMDLAVDLAGITRTPRPAVARKVVVIMAGDHGVTAEGVSRYPQEVTAQMVRNFMRGSAGINALARAVGARVVVVDMGVAGDLHDLAATGNIISKRLGPGTGNIGHGPAMTRLQAIRAIEAGIEVAVGLAEETDVFGIGDMGIGNTTPSAAIAVAFTGASAAAITGRGTGIDDKQWRAKVAVVARALEINRPDAHDPLDVLAKVGGFEIGGIAGVILGAAARRKPVLLDGFISTAAAMIAHQLCPVAKDYMIAAHRSAESGHGIMLEYLGLKPLLDLNLRLGEGTGAALAMPLVESAARLLTDVATFAEAQVSEAKR